MRAVTAGAGALEALSIPGAGRVLAGLAKACYLDLPGGLVALVAPGVAPGPLHVVLDSPPPRPPAGSRASVSAEGLDVGDDRLAVGAARPWRGRLPCPAELLAARPLLLDALAPLAQRCLVPPARGAYARGSLRVGDLPGAAGLLAGSGPGLTPAGDDALAGILFGLRGLAGEGAQRQLVAVAAAAGTTLLASACLRWAARGQALACVHDLFGAAARGDVEGARRSARLLGSVGHSSGADFAQGLCWGLRCWDQLTAGALRPATAR